MSRKTFDGTSFERILREAKAEALALKKEIYINAKAPEGLALRIRYQLSVDKVPNLDITWVFDRMISGKRYKKTLGDYAKVGGLTLKQAKEKGDEYLLSAKNPAPPVIPGSKKLVDVCAEYIRSSNFTDQVEKSRNEIKKMIKNYIIPEFGDLTFNALSKKSIMKWKQELVLISKREDSGIERNITTNGNSTAKHAVSYLSAILSFHIETDELDAVNPCFRWSKKENSKRPVPKDRKIRAETEFMKKLGNALAEVAGKFKEPVHSVLLVELLTGARRDEIESMTKSWIDINPSYSRINLPPGFAKNDKKDKKGKEIYLGTLSKEIIQDYASRCRSKNELVFKPVKGGKGKISTRRAMTIIKERVGKPNFTVHDLRHLFSSACIDCKIEGEVRETLLGHNVVQSNKLAYGGSSVKTLQESVQIVEDHLSTMVLRVTNPGSPAVPPARGVGKRK